MAERGVCWLGKKRGAGEGSTRNLELKKRKERKREKKKKKGWKAGSWGKDDDNETGRGGGRKESG